MKAKRILFLAIPAMLLTSCGPGAEITDSKELSDKAAAIAAKQKEIKNYKFIADIDSNGYNESTKQIISRKMKMSFEKNEDGEVKYHSETTSDGKKLTSDFYLVNDSKYKQVMYVDEFDGEKHDTSVYGYDGNELTFGLADTYYILPETYMETFSDPTALIAEEPSTDEEVVVKYFSTGDGNLTIEATTTEKASDDSKEAAISTKEVIKYDNYYFKSASIEATSNKGNTSKLNFSLEVKNKFAITLPSGWEELINKTPAEEA